MIQASLALPPMDMGLQVQGYIYIYLYRGKGHPRHPRVSYKFLGIEAQ